jgi:hypothetical protein
MNDRRRRTRRPAKFTGPLAEPVRLKVHSSSLADGSPEETQQRNFEERVRAFREWISKFDLLFAHYEVKIERRAREERDWFELFVRVVVDLVPGFRIVSADKPGRGRRPDPFEDICLLVDVELVKRGLGSGGSSVLDSKAVTILTNEAPYKSRWGRVTEETLRNKFSKARGSTNPLAKLWRLEGELGQVAREGLIEMFGATRQNIFVSSNKTLRNG